ncbi:DHHA1 domain-containing protein [Bacillus sp. N9]
MACIRAIASENGCISGSFRQLSAPEEGVNVAVSKLLEANRSLEKSLEAAREVLLSYEAKDLLLGREQGVVKAVFVERTMQDLQKLARLLVAEADDVIVLLVAESNERLQFVAGRGAAIETRMKQVSAAALQALNGKGGGNDAFVQGGGERVISGEELLEVMVKSVL